MKFAGILTIIAAAVAVSLTSNGSASVEKPAPMRRLHVQPLSQRSTGRSPIEVLIEKSSTTRRWNEETAEPTPAPGPPVPPVASLKARHPELSHVFDASAAWVGKQAAHTVYWNSPACTPCDAIKSCIYESPAQTCVRSVAPDDCIVEIGMESTAVCVSESTCDRCRCEACCDARKSSLYFSADSLFLNRNIPDRGIAVLETGVGPNVARTGTSVLSGDDLDFDVEPGVRFTIGRENSDGDFAEFAFFGLHDWNAQAGAFDPADKIAIHFLPDFDDFDDVTRVDAGYSSQLQSFELNAGGNLGESGRAFLGLRYIDVEEDFSLFVVDDLPNDDATYNVKTRNYLFGPQIGGSWVAAATDSLSLDVHGKAGLLLNLFDVSTTVVQSGGPQPAFAENRQNEEGVGTILELGAMLRYHVSDSMQFRVGYEFMAVNGVALAIDQNPDSSDVGSILYYGPSVGFEIHR